MTAQSTTTTVLDCHQCGKKYNVTRFKPGKRFRCKDCHAILTVPKAAVEERGRYDARKKILFCASCARPVDVRNRQPKESFPCPKCQATMEVPAEHVAAKVGKAKEVGESVYDQETKSLRCNGCGSEYMVARYEPGREILCLGCEAVLLVPSDHVPARHSERPASQVKEQPEPAAEEAPPQEEEVEELPEEAFVPAEQPPAPPTPSPAARPAAKSGVEVKEAPQRPPPRPAGQRVHMGCEKCGHPMDVTGFDAGRTVMCPKCEHLGKVREGLSTDSFMDSASELGALAPTSAGNLAVISLDDGAAPAAAASSEAPVAAEQEAAADIDATRRVFSDFYKGEQQKAAKKGETSKVDRKDTRATRLVNTVEIDEILEPRVKTRRTLEDAATKAAGLVAKRAAAEKKTPVFVVTGLVLALGASGVATWVFLKSRQDRQRDLALKSALETSAKVERDKEVEQAETEHVLKAGQRVEVKGLVKGDPGCLLAGDRHGFLLVTRGRGTIWCEDPTRSRGDRFRSLAKRHEERDVVGLQMTGTLRPLAELRADKLPDEVARLVGEARRAVEEKRPPPADAWWVELEPASLDDLKYDEEYLKSPSSLKALK